MGSLNVDEQQGVDTPSEEMNFTHLTCRDCGITDKWNRGIYTELDEAIEDRKNRNPEVYREK